MLTSRDVELWPGQRGGGRAWEMLLREGALILQRGQLLGLLLVDRVLIEEARGAVESVVEPLRNTCPRLDWTCRHTSTWGLHC